MSASMAYLSVFCKRSEVVVLPRTIVKCSWEDTFSEIVSKLDKVPEEAVVEKILISKSEKIVDPVHIVSLDTPLLLSVNSLAASKSVPQAAVPVAPTAGRSASGVLMASAREIVFPPPLTAPDGKQLKTTLVCSSPIEPQYYGGATLVSFPPICYHCGIGEESLVV